GEDPADERDARDVELRTADGEPREVAAHKGHEVAAKLEEADRVDETRGTGERTRQDPFAAAEGHRHRTRSTVAGAAVGASPGVADVTASPAVTARRGRLRTASGGCPPTPRGARRTTRRTGPGPRAPSRCCR